ncbi:BQ5605_C008g05351 [Microbotryum silenes-dioicae]|uniref:BQ5605_C008g05351 protein n=1 Tax=Microbotryum silenes-dioicae TaxID=796604 RepID=A0A2X0MHJ6_9BASI|nr:BQ5605_C008g05351 [Microbotryum silenes-dioicae]
MRLLTSTCKRRLRSPPSIATYHPTHSRLDHPVGVDILPIRRHCRSMPASPSVSRSSRSGSPAASVTASASAGAAGQPYHANHRDRKLPIRRSAKACVACRRAKARCDGPELWPCRRCRESCHECIFDGVPREELGTRLVTAATSSDQDIGAAPIWSTERRLLQVEQELAVLQRTIQEHAALLVKATSTSAPDHSNGQAQQQLSHAGPSRRTEFDHKGKERERGNPIHQQQHHQADANRVSFEPGFPSFPSASNALPASIISAGAGGSGHVAAELSIDDPMLDRLSRSAFDTFWTHMAPWAPYIDPTIDTYDAVRARSPLLLYCILSIATRFHSNAAWSHQCEQQALKYMRATVYSDIPPTLDDLKGTLLYNAWLSRGAPPGHSCTLASQLDLPRSLERLLSMMDKPDANRAFEQLMPTVRTWLSLYAQDLWLSIATGRRGLVTIDFSVTSARSLLKFEALRPVDARIIAQSELVTILGGVQENFVKTQQTSIAETVNIIQRADKHFDAWMDTWSAWAELQEQSTWKYMIASFKMQCEVGRFYINTLGLRDITSPEEVQPIQMPVIKSAIKAAFEVQLVAQKYGSRRMGYSTEFTLISCCSAALFLLKMIKLMPDEFKRDPEGDVKDVATTLGAIKLTSKLLAEAPRQNYHLAVASALSHLESQYLSPSFVMDSMPNPMMPTGFSGNSSSSGSTPGGQNAVLFDPELELAISSVIEESNFWSWSQAQPADSFSGLLS